MNNLPYIQILKGDFLRSYISATSLTIVGLWLWLKILMHDSEKTGYLVLNGSPMPVKLIAKKIGISIEEYEILLAELMSVGAFQKSDEGILFCPELVKLEHERILNAQRQKRFREKSNGDVMLIVTDAKLESNGKTNGEIICSSSSSSSSSSSPSSNSTSAVADVEEKKTAAATQINLDFLNKLKETNAYRHIKIEVEFEKAKIWCVANKRKCNQRFFVNWLNRILKSQDNLNNPAGAGNSDANGSSKNNGSNQGKPIDYASKYGANPVIIKKQQGT